MPVLPAISRRFKTRARNPVPCQNGLIFQSAPQIAELSASVIKKAFCALIILGALFIGGVASAKSSKLSEVFKLKMSSLFKGAFDDSETLSIGSSQLSQAMVGFA